VLATHAMCILAVKQTLIHAQFHG